MQGSTLSLSPSEKERQEQIREAKRLSQLDFDTDKRGSSSNVTPIRSDSTKSGATSAKMPKLQESTAVKKKYVPKGHDGILKDLQAHRAPVFIEFMNGETVEGVIVASDRYTISLRKSVPESGYDDIEHFYKHGIRSFGKTKNEVAANE